MGRFRGFLGAAAVAAAIASSAPAQQRQMPGAASVTQFMLLTQPSVQKELKLSDDQAKAVKTALDKQTRVRMTFPDLDKEERDKKMKELNTEGDKVVADVLKPDQAKRLRQIYLQQLGAQAFNQPEVAGALKITEEQKQKVKQIQQDVIQEMRKGVQPGGDREEMRKKIAQATRTINEKALALLTPEQKAKWQELTGEPFKGEIRMGPPGGQRPGRAP